jgi:hypothetical protein
LYRRWVASASAPQINATSSSPDSTCSAAPFTKTCGVVPPMPE